MIRLHQTACSKQVKDGSLTSAHLHRATSVPISSHDWGEGAICPTRPRHRQLTRKEVRTICSLINDYDKEFIYTLMSHVHADTRVARAVFKGICRAPELLTPAAGARILELLRHQEQPKYAINLALAVLASSRFLDSAGIIEKSAQVLSSLADRLTESQYDRLLNRALTYPLSDPMPSRCAAPAGRLDYGGAVSVALLADVSPAHIDRGELLDTAITFARRYPQAKNLWLIPLREHDPRRFKEWQVFSSGGVPPEHLAREALRAALITSLPSSALFVAVKINQIDNQKPPQPKPPPDIALAILLFGATAWSFGALINFFRCILKVIEKYEVSESQAEQVVHMSLPKHSS